MHAQNDSQSSASQEESSNDPANAAGESRISIASDYGVSVQFGTHADGSCYAYIDTDRLQLRPARLSDAKEYHQKLFGDPEVMAQYNTGETASLDNVEKRLQRYQDRWERGYPFSGFTVRDQSGTFIGMVVSGDGLEPGITQLAYLFAKEHWGQGFAKEAVHAIVRGYMPLLQSLNYEVVGGPTEAEEQPAPIRAIEATAKSDNRASWTILEKVGLDHVKNIETDYGPRQYHQSPVESIDPTASLEVLSLPDQTHYTTRKY